MEKYDDLYMALPVEKWGMLDLLAGQLSDAESRNVKLEKMAFYDELTGIGNRRLLDKKMKEEGSRLSRHGDKYAVVEFDIDYFKRFNDVYGHEAGDEALRVFSEVVGNNIRPSDGFYRHGGEEFYLVLSDVKGKREAQRVVSKLMGKIREARVDVGDGESVGLTSSAGLYLPDVGDSRNDVLKKSDMVLYSAKDSGRDQVGVYYETRDVRSLKGQDFRS